MGMAPDACDLLCLDLPRAEELRTSLGSGRAQRAAAAAQALADPTRMTIALALADGEELCGCDVSYVVERSQALVSHHLKALRAAGLAESRRDGRMVLHRLTDPGRALVGLLAVEEITA
jgi:DNA-binding transcriptional ArsR family regulator